MHFHVCTCLKLCHFLLYDELLCGHVCVWCRGSGVRAVSLEDTLEEERSAFKDEKNRCFMLIYSSPYTHTDMHHEKCARRVQLLLHSSC
jgi:hypothetical protein